MKRGIWIASSLLLVALGIWAAATLDASAPDPSRLFPEGALLYVQAKDFQGLLNDWNTSKEQRAWMAGDDYAAFSRSRLYDRLSQAQDEFSTAANIPANQSLLNSVAGHQSALALYDIGNLEFVYLTRMNQAQIEATALWRIRGKFEPRTEGQTQFFVRQDKESNRIAAFAARDGWLILATRADLIAGVLDRLQGSQARSLPDEPWFGDAIKQAKGPADDLRMIINLEKVVPSPYFRSYWVQRNITEMKEYRSALCDLHRTKQAYREDRVLLRKPGATSTASGDVRDLLALAPSDAAFVSAVALPTANRVLAEMRENLIELKPERAQTIWSAPSAPPQQNAGSASEFEQRIDVAPVIVAQADPYQQLQSMLAKSQPTALLELYTTRAPKDQMFAAIDRAMVVESAIPWNETSTQAAIATAIRPGLTASGLGIAWTPKSSSSGAYAALDGEVQLFLAAREGRLFLATSESLLQNLLAKNQFPAHPPASGVTYAAFFRHSEREQQNFRRIVNRLDASSSGGTFAQSSNSADGKAPPFFSGNIDSLSRTFADVSSESIEEKDQGEAVTQSVVYQWKQQ